MDKRDSYRAQFLEYLKQQPPRLFVETHNVMGHPCDALFREAQQASGLLQKARAVGRVWRAGSSGVVALFPEYLAFFTQGKRTSLLRLAAKQLPLSVIGLDWLADIGGAGVNAGKDAARRIRHERQHDELKLKNVEEWLVHPDAFVIPLSQLASLADAGVGGALWVNEKDGSQYYLFRQQARAFETPWARRLLEAYRRLQEQR